LIAKGRDNGERKQKPYGPQLLTWTSPSILGEKKKRRSSHFSKNGDNKHPTPPCEALWWMT